MIVTNSTIYLLCVEMTLFTYHVKRKIELYRLALNFLEQSCKSVLVAWLQDADSLLIVDATH